ncbi:MAG: DUF4386 domain-containing protein [Actinomycetia bacterium]|nr:DUF4386 domain-containing protein [Actinomycetes bacterium]
MPDGGGGLPHRHRGQGLGPDRPQRRGSDRRCDRRPRPSAIGDSLLAENDGTFGLYVLVFTAAALIFYAMLYRTRLVPRWLSIWGFAAAAWMLAGTVLIMLDVFSGTSDSVQAIFVIPVPLGELALALWLILKGFDDLSLSPPVIPSTPAQRSA